MPTKKATAAPSSQDTKSNSPLTADFNTTAATPVDPAFAGELLPPGADVDSLKGKRFVITAAQNNTAVNENFLKSLETYCGANNAQLLAIPFVYNPKPGFKKADVAYDPKIQKYLFNKSADITKDLTLCGEVNVSPTVANPLTGFDNYCHGASGIIASPQVALKSLPGLGAGNARFLYTTGAVTERNYSDAKAGKMASEHHTYGALLVEVDKDGNFFVRQLTADPTGAFQDLTDKYTPDGKVLHDQPVEAIELGDIHVEKTDPVQESIAFGKGGIMDTMKPKYLFLQDIMDFTARNHHDIDDPFFRAEEKARGNTVEGGIDLVAAWLKEHQSPDRQDIVVASNHNEFFQRWLTEADARYDVDNARFWHECCAERLRQIEAGNYGFDIFEWAVRQKANLPQATFLQENDSFKICKDEPGGGIECAMHGHEGANGSRGSPAGFRTLGEKCNTAHTHTAGIVGDIYTAGVQGDLDMEYNKGPSSWSHSHVITYPDGARAIITTVDGKWRADDVKHDPMPLPTLADVNGTPAAANGNTPQDQKAEAAAKKRSAPPAPRKIAVP